MKKDELSQLFLRAVPRAMWAVRRRMRQDVPGGLTVPQMRILLHLDRGLSSNKDLAEAQGVSVAAMSRMVDLLARKGLLKRQDSTMDRRLVLLSLSRPGQDLLAAHRKRMQAFFAEQVEGLSQAERLALGNGLSLLDKLFPPADINALASRRTGAGKETHVSH